MERHLDRGPRLGRVARQLGVVARERPTKATMRRSATREEDSPGGAGEHKAREFVGRLRAAERDLGDRHS